MDHKIKAYEQRKHSRSMAALDLARRALLGLASLAASSRAITVTPAGPPVTVWASVDSLHKCGVNDTPDIPTRAFQAGDGVVHMITGSTSFHWMTGPTVFNQTRNCSAAWNSTENPDPSVFASAEWLDSPHVFDNGTVVALVHTEFDAMNIQTPKCNLSYPFCWTVTIGLAVSQDFGFTWQHARPPPHHLVASVPYEFNRTQIASGWGDPSNIVTNPADGLFYFAAWNRHQVGLQQPGICLMRTADLTDPASWRGYGGDGEYNVSFVSPYGMPPGDAGAHVCTVAKNLPNCPVGGIAWSTYLLQFVAVICCNGGGVSFSFSPDLVDWTVAEELYSFKDLPPAVQKNVTSFTYPSLLDPAAAAAVGDKNYNTIGQDAPLFWASIGHSPYTDGRRVWSTPMHYER